MKPNATIVLAAGGTGGHLFPAEALASELLARGCRVALVTDRRGQGFGDRLAGVEVHRVSAGGIAGANLIDRARSALHLAWGTLQARAVLGRLSPAIAVGFGGYPSVPTMLAAARAGVATILHEQNAVLGRANRLLAGRASRVAISFPTLLPAGRVDPAKLAVTGNPVRPAIAALADTPYPALGTVDPVHILVTGGSQGARVFSRVLPAAVALLPELLRARLRMVQQCRPEDLESVRAAYARLGVEAALSSFFDDMPQRLATAHLVVARAGASTCAELTAAGRPSLLVPYPFAADDHQSANATALAEAGAAWSVSERQLGAGELAEKLQALLQDPATLPAAATRALACGRRGAAAALATLVLDSIPGNHAGNHGSGPDAHAHERKAAA